MAASHDGANRQARIAAAFATRQDTVTRGDEEEIACSIAIWADETATPSSIFQVGRTLCFIGNKLTKLW